MTHHRKTIATAAATAILALSAAMPVAALGNPLLSGYGGPGLGSQAILGSALLNGPAGGGGGSAPGSSGAAPASAESSTGGVTPGAGAGVGLAAARSAGHASRTGGRAERAAGASAQASGPSKLYPASERGVAEPAGTLGLSGQDLLLILLAIGALAVTAVLTARLTAKPRQGDTAS